MALASRWPRFGLTIDYVMRRATSRKSSQVSAARPSVQLTIRDREIVASLTGKIDLVDVCQAARTWWQDNAAGRECAEKRLRQLANAGELCTLSLRIHPELPLNAPVWAWNPGEPLPPFGVISYRLRARWSEPLRWITAFAASKRSARQRAGRGGRLPRPIQATHDLHVSAIYLRLLRQDPTEAAGWVSEHVFASLRKGKKLPDAEIQDRYGRTLKVIEFGGSYPPERVKTVHEDCERRGVPYELW
jgi:hypothetical protein